MPIPEDGRVRDKEVERYFLFLQFLLTPLHLACWYGQESIVKLLLEHGADVSARDRVSLKNTLRLNLPVILC